MKCLKRNKTRFYYSLYEGTEAAEDEYGNLTGEHTVIRGSPQECYGNVSAAKGETQVQQFGESESYDKVIVMDANAPPIDEYTVLWVDTLPQFDENGEVIPPHDYIVKKVAKSLNSVAIAIRKVTVS